MSDVDILISIKESFRKTKNNIRLELKPKDIQWLIEQADKVDKLEERNKKYRDAFNIILNDKSIYLTTKIMDLIYDIVKEYKLSNTCHFAKLINIKEGFEYSKYNIELELNPNAIQWLIEQADEVKKLKEQNKKYNKAFNILSDDKSLYVTYEVMGLILDNSKK